MNVMEFLRYSTPLDWLVMFITAVLIIVGLILVFVLRNPKPFYIVIVSAAIPLAGGLLSTTLKLSQLQRALTMVERAPAELTDRASAEAWMISYIAATGAIIIGLLGLIGVVTKRRAVR